MGKLTAAGVKQLVTPGRYGDGDGLWLQVRDADRRFWIFRYILRGKERRVPLGSVAEVSLADARVAAGAFRKVVDSGVDPMEEHYEQKAIAAQARIMPCAEIGAFMADLRSRAGIGSLALQFVILTACGINEALGASWSEIDAGRAMWTIPAARRDGGRDHRIPLSGASLDVLEKLTLVRSPIDDYVFPGLRIGATLGPLTLSAVLRRMGRTDLTVPGFRSTFRAWAAERTSYSPETVAAALTETPVGAADADDERMEARTAMMTDWAAFCVANHDPAPTALRKTPHSRVQ